MDECVAFKCQIVNDSHFLKIADGCCPSLYAASHVSHPTLWVPMSMVQGSKLWHGPAEYPQFTLLNKLLGCEKD